VHTVVYDFQCMKTRTQSPALHCTQLRKSSATSASALPHAPCHAGDHSKAPSHAPTHRHHHQTFLRLRMATLRISHQAPRAGEPIRSMLRHVRVQWSMPYCLP
jgi:hypothetical protein